MPGVPPDAVENVKKLFKGMFRRGKNKKQNKPSESAATTQTTQTTASTASQQKPTAADTAPNTDKPLPPTHPLETGPHDKPQEALRQNHNAPPELPGNDGTQEAKKGSGSATVSPASVTQGAPSSEPVSAIEKDTPPAPPPKNDESIVAAATSAPAAAPKVEEATAKENVAPTNSAQRPAAPATNTLAATTSAPAQPNGTTTSAGKAEQAPKDSVAEATEASKSSAEEKVAVQEEIKPAQKAQPSGGMSATSGPLEDYPLGFGDKE